jgi:DNA-binding transcriptional LysR family regulator
MDLWQLHIFCNVVEQRSFSKAGKIVHLSQPTVSTHIKDLENHFGCRLIDRLSKKADPTREGELLYQYAVKLIALRDEAETALALFKGTVKGTLVVGGSTIAGSYILPRVIGGFLKKYPNVFLSLKVRDTGEIIQDILAGELELGVVGARASGKQLNQTILLKDEMRLIVPVDHPWADKNSVSLEMLIQERLIIRESGSGTLKSIEENLRRNGHQIEEFNIVAELGSTQAAVEGIKNRIGLSIVSPVAVSEELQAGTLKALSISGLDLTRNFYLTRHNHRSLSPPAKAFAAYLTQEFRR